MNTEEERNLGCLAMVLVVVVAFTIRSCMTAEASGRCLEAWTHAQTATDTLATVRRGCALPETK